MHLKSVLLGLAVLATSFYASLQAMDRLWPRTVERPVLAQLPPLPLVSRQSVIVAPVAVAVSAIEAALERAAPRDLGGKATNPIHQILSDADINWTIARGPIAASGAADALTLKTPIEGKLTATGSLDAGKSGQLGDALGQLLGSSAAKQIGRVSIKSLNANAAIRGSAAMTARPQITTEWRIDPQLSAQVNLDNTSLSVAGAKVAVPAQVKPIIDKNINAQIDLLQQRLRNDRTLENNARRQWDRMCRSIALPAADASLPPLFLEMRPVSAFAAQPRIDARNVTLTIGLQAETRIVTAQTQPKCPFPANLAIVPADRAGGVKIAVPIDLSFAEVSRIVEAQLRGRSFPEDGSGSLDVSVKSASVDAEGDRLLISLLVNAREKASYFGFGGDATIRIRGRPVLDQNRQILQLADLDVALDSDAAFGLLGTAAQAAIPYLQRALAEHARIDLKALTTSAQQKLASVITDLRTSDDGLRVETDVTGLRLGDIAFDSHTLRVIVEVSGSLAVAVTSLPH